MKIRTKGIYFDRYEDAPFVGVLISAINCSNNCKHCFNQHLKKNNIIEYDIEELISILKENKFCNGIILSGLEWTEQKEELECIVRYGLRNKFKIILYTGLDEKEFKLKFKDIYNKPIYIKFGKYDETKKVDNYYMHQVKLASKNQYIRGEYYKDYKE